MMAYNTLALEERARRALPKKMFREHVAQLESLDVVMNTTTNK
jgi:hypothetical protein